MNPFVAFLILAPLLASIALTVGVAVGLIKHGPRWDIISAFVILNIISGCLIVLLRRTSRGPLIEFRGSEQVDVSIRKNVTVFSLSVIYLALGLMAILLLNIESVQNWVGLLCFVLGLLMCYSGISQLNFDKILRLEQSEEAIVTQLKMLETSLSSHTRIRNYLLLSSVLTAVFAILLYGLMDGGKVFSLFDLLGSLFLLGSVVMWFVVNGISRQKKVLALRRQLEGR